MYQNRHIKYSRIFCCHILYTQLQFMEMFLNLRIYRNELEFEEFLSQLYATSGLMSAVPGNTTNYSTPDLSWSIPLILNSGRFFYDSWFSQRCLQRLTIFLSPLRNDLYSRNAFYTTLPRWNVTNLDVQVAVKYIICKSWLWCSRYDRCLTSSFGASNLRFFIAPL